MVEKSMRFNASNDEKTMAVACSGFLLSLSRGGARACLIFQIFDTVKYNN